MIDSQQFRPATQRSQGEGPQDGRYPRADDGLRRRGPRACGGLNIEILITTRGVAERAVAAEVAELMRARARSGRPCVLGLATGGTMVGVYRELVRLHRQEGLSFAGVHTINLDEYLDLDAGDPRSFASFMHQHLFDHIDIDPGRTFVPDGRVARREPLASAQACLERIESLGSIDLQLLGVGRNGHLGFNEPGTSHTSHARVIELAPETRADAAATFGGIDRVPQRSLTLGMADILGAERLRVLAFGKAKARVIAAALTGPVSRSIPASALRLHDDVRVWLDSEAAAEIDPEMDPESHPRASED